MPTKDDEIAALKAMLKRAEARAKKAKSRAERAEKKLQDKEELIERYDILLPILLKEVRLCREQVLKLKSEFPEIQADIWQELVKNLLSDFENIPQYRQLARLFSKGSEKAGRPVSPQKLRNELDAEGKAALCGIITRSQKMKQALTLVDAGAKPCPTSKHLSSNRTNAGPAPEGRLLKNSGTPPWRALKSLRSALTTVPPTTKSAMFETSSSEKFRSNSTIQLSICFWSSATGAAPIAAMCTTICLQIRICRLLPAVRLGREPPLCSARFTPRA